jgi:predicted nucleic acid-binding protein
MPSYSTVCLDASLIVRMFDPEFVEYVKVRELWDIWHAQRMPLIAPSLLRYEVTNAVFRPVRLGLADADRALNVLRSLDKFPIRYFDAIALNVAAFEVARDLKLSAAYDAHYVALARQERAGLYTADIRLANAASSKFPFVRYVMDE